MEFKMPPNIPIIGRKPVKKCRIILNGETKVTQESHAVTKQVLAIEIEGQGLVVSDGKHTFDELYQMIEDLKKEVMCAKGTQTTVGEM